MKQLTERGLKSPEITRLEGMDNDPLASIPSFSHGQIPLPSSLNMSPDDFSSAVQDALDAIPSAIRQEMDNVAIFIADRHVPGPGDDPAASLLGLYEGTPLTERDAFWASGSLPDRITIYRENILEICSSRQEVIDQVTITVVHEIAHHFGIDDATLHELGWG